MTRQPQEMQELEEILAKLREQRRKIYPNDPRNDIPPYMTGVE